MRNFFVSNDEKLTEKAFSRGIMMSVFSILLCIAVFCSASYAWFTEETTNTENTIMAGSFDLDDVSIEKIEENPTDSTFVEITESADGVLSCTLSDAGSYRVTLTRNGSSTANGYCFVKLGNNEKQATESIANSDGESLVFTLTITTAEAGATLELTPWWGIHSNPSIKNNDVISMINK